MSRLRSTPDADVPLRFYGAPHLLPLTLAATHVPHRQRLRQAHGIVAYAPVLRLDGMAAGEHLPGDERRHRDLGKRDGGRF